MHPNQADWLESIKAIRYTLSDIYNENTTGFII